MPRRSNVPRRSADAYSRLHFDPEVALEKMTVCATALGVDAGEFFWMLKLVMAFAALTVMSMSAYAAISDLESADAMIALRLVLQPAPGPP
jgi:hypothetical protein